MQLSIQQDQALIAVNKWLKDRGRNQIFYLAGFAGTGKTTIARQLAESVPDVVFGAFTGKAALVMQSKGCANASTIHSLIYIRDKDGRDPTWRLNKISSPLLTAKLVVIDECSMVGEELGRDLLSFGKPVLVLGDPAQLPPVKGEGFFTSREPDFLLTEVHRQAADNPIIRMSMDVREGRGLPHGAYGSSRVISRAELSPDDVLDADQVIVGMNKTRRQFNARMRELLGFSGKFMEGDKLVSLRNDKERGILNGGLWSVGKIIKSTSETTALEATSLDGTAAGEPVKFITHHAWLDGSEGDIPWKEQKKYSPLDYAYVLSCHKSQGSQWEDVMVFDESGVFRDDADKWLYTAITRAAERVTVIR